MIILRVDPGDTGVTKRKLRKVTAGLLIGFLACLPSLSYAIGLGQLKVHSALDEPLNGEIPFTSLNAAERRKLDIKLATRTEFATAGIDRASSLGALKFSVAKRVDGRYFLHVRTDEPFREPFLHMLIHLQWAGGRLIREYTALIDPPYLAAGQPSQIETPKIAAIPEPEPIKKSAVPEPEPAGKEVAVVVPDFTPVESVQKAEPEPVAPTPEPVPANNERGEVSKEAEPEFLALEPELKPLDDQPVEKEASQSSQSGSQVADSSDTFGPEKDSSAVKMTASGWPEDEVSIEQPVIEELAADDRGKPVEDELLLEPELGPEAGQPGQPDEPIVADSAPSDGEYFGPSDSGEYVTGDYQVNKGDTLWQIAKQARPDSSVSVEQVAMAIFRSNQRAFFNNNVNNLKAGKILSIPDSAELTSSDASSDKREFHAQYSVWQEHKLKMASASNTLQMDENAGVQMESMESSESTEEAATESTNKDSGESVKESASALLGAILGEEKSDSTIAKSGKSDTEKADTKSEKSNADESKKIAGADKETKDAADITPKPSEGMAAEDLLKIVRSKQEQDKAEQDKAVPDSESRDQDASSEKAALADKVATLEESLTSTDLANEEAGKRAGNVSEQLDTQKRLIELENQNLAQGQPVEPNAKQESDAGKTTGSDAAKKPVTPVKPPVPAPPQQSFMDQMMEMVSGVMEGSASMLPIIGGAAAVALMFVALMVFRRRRNANIEFEESILNSQVDSEGTLSMDSGDESESGDTSFLSDFSQGGMGNVSTDEVDPVAEAEVYLAYGRDEQAEEILKDAIVKEPARHELREKILEIYSQRDDVSAFETVAEELYAALEGRGGELWDRVAAMGAKLNPDNPMFGGEGAGMATGGTDTGEITNVGLDDSGAFDMPTAMTDGDASPDPSTDQTIQADAMDFSMEGSLDIGTDDSGSAPDTTTTDESEEIDFSLSMGGDTGAPADDDAGSLDFSMDDATEGTDDDAGSLDFSMEDSEVASTDDAGSLDFSMEDSEVASTDDAGSLDFSMDDATESTDDDAGSLDFSMEDSAATESTDDENISWDVDTADADGDSELSSDDSGLDMMMGAEDSEVAVADGDGDQEQWDETATKLDLARAYIDMGDAEGARSILDEVLAEGNEDQKKQAAELASQIA